MFEHRLIPFQEVSSVTLGEQGRFYRKNDGPWYPSVTTVLGKMMNKEWLKAWTEKVGKDKADKIMKRACLRGTSLHNIMEKYIRNDDSWEEDDPIDLILFRKVRPEIDQNVGTVLGIEVPLYCPSLRLAGRSDLVALWDGVPSIIDYKSSLFLRNEERIQAYLLQATLYSIMAQELFSINIPRIVLIIMVDSDLPQIVVRETARYENEAVDLVRRYHALVDREKGVC